MIKKRYLFLIFFICLFSISAVSAEEIGNNNGTSVGSGSNAITEPVGNSYGNFSELQEEINAVGVGGTLNLTRNYKYVNGSTNGISITKAITIDGQGHTIDGNQLSRAFYITGNNVVLKNISFINAKILNSNGGAIIWEGSNGTLDNSTFINCSAKLNKKPYLSGGAIFWSGNGGKIGSCIFINNSISGSYSEGAGAINIQDNGKFYIVNSTFINNSAQYGGAIIANGNVTIVDSSFFNNSASTAGGAIDSRGNVIVLNSSFFNNSVGYASGAIDSRGNLTVVDSSFFNNSAEYAGGDIYIWEDAILNVDNCSFFNNSANAGGAIYGEGMINLVNSRFVNNYATVRGGAIYTLNNVSMYNCSFIGNHVGENGEINAYGGYGGAIYASFYHNLYEYVENFNLFNCTFIDNHAENSGGAINTIFTDKYGIGEHDEYFNIINCSFINNSAVKAGAINIDQSSYSRNIFHGNITNCSFSNNLANDSGGAIYTYNTKNLNIFNSTFCENNANVDGAAISYNSTLNNTISDCLFINNSMGGIHTIGWFESSGIVNNSYFMPEKGVFSNYSGVTIFKKKTILESSNISFEYKYNATFSAILKNDDGILKNNEILIDMTNGEYSERFYSITNGSGVASLNDELCLLNVGVWNVSVIYEGNDNYYPCDTISTITVLPLNTSLTILDANAIINHEIYIIATVISDFTVNEGNVTFFDDDNQIAVSQVTNGNATLIYTPTTAGEHKITAVFDSVNYLNSTGLASLFVDSAKVDILVENGTVGFNSTFVADVKGLYSTVNEGNVKFYVNNEYLGVVPVVNGSVSINHIPLIASDYTVTAIYCDSDKFLDDEDSEEYHVSKADTKVIVNEVNGIIDQEVIISANITSSNNLTINEGIVSFYIGDEFVGDASVISGVASLTYEILDYASEYTITAIYNGNNYLSSNGTAKLFVNPCNVNVSKYSSFGTFKALSKLIENTPEGGVLTLTKDYIYVSGSTEGIRFAKQITIDGQGHVLDGTHVSRILNSYDDNIVLKNIDFINGYTKDWGGASYIYGNNVFIVNCTFENCSSNDGGAIYIYGEKNSVINCTFSKCSVFMKKGQYTLGGAIWWRGDDGNISNCRFVNNFGFGDESAMGGAICIWESINYYINNCTFENNYLNCSYNNGAAIAVYATDKCIINNSTFINNSADGAISVMAGNYLEINDCLFFDNTECSVTGRGKSWILNKNIFSSDFNNFYVPDDTKIIKFNLSLSCESIEFTYCKPTNFDAFLVDDDGNNCTNKKLIFNLNKEKISQTFIKTTNNYGIASIQNELKELTAGIWNVTVIFEGTDNYYPYNITSSITVLPSGSSLTIENVNTTVGHEISFISNVTSDLIIDEGVVVFFDGGTEIGESQVKNGKATLTYTPTTDGEHIITAIFNSDNYLSSNATASLFVDSATVDLLVENGTVGFNSTFVAEVKGLYSTVNQGNVKFYINDEYLGKVPVVNGSASINYVPLIASDYTVTAIYCDSDKFLDDEDSTAYHVSKANTETVVNDLNGTVGHDIIITTIVTSSNNLTINEGTVVFFDGEIKIGESQVKNGKATLTYVPTTDGEHAITTVFDSVNYLNSSGSASLFVDSATIDLLVENGTVGFNSTFIAKVKGLYSTVNEGNVKFYINDEYLGKVPVVNGSASINYVPLIASDYTVTAIYCDSDKFLDDEDSTAYHVSKANTETVVNDLNGTVGHDIIITTIVTSSNNLTINEGTVVFFDGEIKIGESEVKNGVATLTYVPMTAGERTITAVFDSDNYLNSTNTNILAVEKASIDLNINEILTVFFSNPSDFNVNIKSNSKEVNEGKIKYYLNNKLIGSSFVKNGKANFDYIVNESGTFNLLVRFDETDNYLSSNTSTRFSVVRMPTTLSGNSIIFDENDTKTYTTVLTDNNKNGVVNQSVEILVIKYSGEYSNFYGVTDSNGVSTYDINSLNGGMWYITGTFSGDENYIGSSFEDKFIIIKIETTTTIEEINNPRVNHTYKLKANIHDENGKLVKEGIVQFYLDGVDIGSIDLSKNQGHQNGLLGASNPINYKLGVDEDDSDLYLEYTPSEAGNYTLSAVYEGTTLYKSSSKTTSFIVSEESPFTLSAPDVTKYYKGSERFVVNLSDNNNKPISNAEVKITINGQTYTKTTGSSGQTSLAINLDSGKYDVITEYNGTSVYSTVTVKPTIIADDLTKMYKNGTQYYATFIDTQGNPLPKGTEVTFNINGVMYTRKTNEMGIAKLNINLDPLTYIITAINPVNGEKHSNLVTVLPKIINNKDLTKYYKNASQYVVTLLGDDGKVVGAGETVTFNINGVFYTRTTNASGQAKLNINLDPGTFIITADYKGSKASNTITVKSVLFAHNLNMKYRDGSKFEAKVLDGQGKPLSGATVRFNINGVFYYRVTGSDGIARLNINLLPGEFIITSSYNGLNIANIVKIANDPMYYTIGSNPIASDEIIYEMGLDCNCRLITDIYGNTGMHSEVEVVDGITYWCYQASTDWMYLFSPTGVMVDNWNVAEHYS